jgi:isoquinoline 1-oxidoreductase beta subunit
MTVSSAADTPQASKVSRRDLLAGALVIGFAMKNAAKAWAAEPNVSAANGAAGLDSGSEIPSFAPNGFISIGRDGRILLVMPSTEMGQGIYTAEATLIAEELEIGLDQLEVVAAPPEAANYAQPLFKAQLTGGSTSIRGFWTPLRRAGAAARMMLVAAAAERWKIDPKDCVAHRGVVSHPPTGRALAYSALVDFALRQQLPQDVPLKAPKDFKLIGSPLKRIDTPAKVKGAAIFGIDVVVPGIKVAAIAMCPVDDGRLRSLDDTATRKLPGVVDVIRIDDAVAVVGDHYWAAKTGLDALQIDWDLGPNAAMSSETIRNDQKAAASAGTPIKGLLNGDIDAAFTAAKTRIEAVYELPFLAHATMEPINTTVHVRPDGCDIWVGTQTPVVAQLLAAKITGHEPEKVVIHNQLIGGGFGRRLQADTIEQAVSFARQVKYPLKLIWTREQDIRHDRFRPAYYDQIAAGLDEHGSPIAWTHRITSGTVRKYFDAGGWPEGQLDKDAVDGSWDTPYDFPVIRVDWIRHDPPVKLNWWRGVGPTHNVFVVESFLDEVAHFAGRDPIDYRRHLLARTPRSLAVLNLAAEKAQWGDPLPPRSGRGVSLHKNFDTHAAVIVEASVAPTGEIALRRIVAAIDCGIQINPDTIRAQIEGGVLFGLSAALYNGITFQAGQVQQGNFNDYRQLRINEVPPIDVHLVASDAHPGGMGEVGTVSAAPALANAVFAATGIRVRRLPFDRAMLATKDSA